MFHNTFQHLALDQILLIQQFWIYCAFISFHTLVFNMIEKEWFWQPIHCRCSSSPLFLCSYRVLLFLNMRISSLAMIAKLIFLANSKRGKPQLDNIKLRTARNDHLGIWAYDNLPIFVWFRAPLARSRIFHLKRNFQPQVFHSVCRNCGRVELPKHIVKDYAFLSLKHT